MTTTGPADWTVTTARAYAVDVLTGERVRLRALRTGDLEALVAWRNAPAVDVLQTDAVNPTPADAVSARLLAHASQSGAAAYRGFCVETRPADADEEPRLLGWVTLGSISWPHRSAELAISLDPASGGHGYGLDATRTMVRYGFRELGLHRIWLTAWAFNEPALRTYRRAGFVEEGRLRDVVLHDGRWHDQVVMGRLATDPEPGWASGR